MPGSERRVLDVVARVEPKRGSSSIVLVHVEIQSQAADDFARRMFFYFSRLHELKLLPVYPIALFTYDALGRDEPNSYELQVKDFNVLTFRFVPIQLRKLRWRDSLTRRNPVAAALMSKMGYTIEERPRVKAECIRLLSALSLDRDRMALIGSFIDTYLSLDSHEEVAYNKFVEGFPMPEQQRVLELTTSWERKGREEGRAEGQIGMLVRLVEKRFGPMTTEDRSLLLQLSGHQLETLADSILDAADHAEWRRHLLALVSQSCN